MTSGQTKTRNLQSVRWNGLVALYHKSELRWMEKLYKNSKREALFIHEAKSRFDGKLFDVL